MTDMNYNADKLDEDLKEAMKIKDKPSIQLNNILKAEIQHKEQYLAGERRGKEISLWYLPMLLSTIFFVFIGIVAFILIPYSLVVKVVCVGCLGGAVSGIVFTFLACKFFNLKEEFSVEF